MKLSKIKEAACSVLDLLKSKKLHTGYFLMSLAVIAMVFVLSASATHASKPEVTYAETEDYFNVKIGDKVFASVSSLEDAEQIINGVKSYYTTFGNEVVSITLDPAITVERVSYNSETDRAPILTDDVEAVVDEIVAGETATETVVITDNTMWDIAMERGIDIDDLLAANPGVVPEQLKPGDEIIVNAGKPYVNVTVEQNIQSEKPIAYNTVYEETSDLYEGEEEVKTEGVDGRKLATDRVITVNGLIKSTEEISSTVITEPVDEVILKGTASRPVATSYSYSTVSVSAPAYTGSGQAVADYAAQFAGVLPYVWGGTSLSSGCDCSGFIYAVYQACGYNISRFPEYSGYEVSASEMQPGDVIVYPSHYALYIGGGLEVEELNEYTGCVIRSVGSVDYTYWVCRILG
ncbi:MAG: G5 domain-containing protein [Eubacterium sp.]|jgi:cell wall-associated NlpC family hydrolase